MERPNRVSIMIHYSHVNEDNRIERDLLQQTGCRAVVAVAGSGERLLALMDAADCREFHAVDLNEEALFLLQLKLAALQGLSVEEYWQYCGHQSAPKGQRTRQFHAISELLPLAALLYWQERLATIEKGILHAGHFERFLQRLRPLLLFFLGRNFRLVLAGSNAGLKKFPATRWKLLQKLFSLSWIYRIAGNRDPAFVGRGASVSHIPLALDGILRQGKAASCFMAQLIFTGHLGAMAPAGLPPSLQKEVLQRVKQRLLSAGLRIVFHHSDMLQFVEEQRPETGPVFYSLSDILSFEEPAYMAKLLNRISGQGNTVVWRTFLRNRVDEPGKCRLSQRHPAVQEHTENESTGMYQVFSITDKKNEPYEPAAGSLSGKI